MISKYINELKAFVSDIEQEITKSKENILGTLKKPKKK
jgi:hypothetical protein